METFLVIVHILVALVLIILVLLQDSKGGGMGGAFGGGSSSVFGATGAATLAQKMTRWAAVFFAGTCIALSVMAGKQNASVVDSGTMPLSTTTTSSTTTTTQPTK